MNKKNIIEDLMEERNKLQEVIQLHGITTRRPSNEPLTGSLYCSQHKCYTTTEFALLGLGAVIIGIMVGVVGISWFKYSCLPNEKHELEVRERDLSRQNSLLKVSASRDFNDSKHLIENEFRDAFQKSREKIPPHETDF